ncbi:MAG: hypothetical protein AAGE93_19885 [Bacteroidota bacterium]
MLTHYLRLTIVLTFLLFKLAGCTTEPASETVEEVVDSTTTDTKTYEAVSLLGDTLYPM